METNGFHKILKYSLLQRTLGIHGGENVDVTHSVTMPVSSAPPRSVKATPKRITFMFNRKPL